MSCKCKRALQFGRESRAQTHTRTLILRVLFFLYLFTSIEQELRNTLKQIISIQHRPKFWESLFVREHYVAIE